MNIIPCANTSSSSYVVECAYAVYALARRIVIAVYTFFERLIFGEPVVAPDVAAVTDKGSHVALRLAERLNTVFSAQVRCSEEEARSVAIGTFIFDRLLGQGKGGVEFDPKTEIYTVKFPEAKVIPIFFHEKIAQKLKGHVVEPEIHVAKDVQFKLGERKIEILGNSLIAKAKVDMGFMGRISMGAAVRAMADEHPETSAHMLASIALTDDTHVLVRGFINNVICPLLSTHLSRILVRREPGVRLLHQIL